MKWHCFQCGRVNQAPLCAQCDGKPVPDLTPWRERAGWLQDAVVWLLDPAFAWSDWRIAKRNRKPQ